MVLVLRNTSLHLRIFSISFMATFPSLSLLILCLQSPFGLMTESSYTKSLTIPIQQFPFYQNFLCIFSMGAIHKRASPLLWYPSRGMHSHWRPDQWQPHTKLSADLRLCSSRKVLGPSDNNFSLSCWVVDFGKLFCHRTVLNYYVTVECCFMIH